MRYGFLAWLGSWFRSEEEVCLDLASAAKGAQLLSDEDIMVEYLGFSRNEARAAVARMHVQKLKEVKLSMMWQNPTCCPCPGPDVDEAPEDKA